MQHLFFFYNGNGLYFGGIKLKDNKQKKTKYDDYDNIIKRCEKLSSFASKGFMHCMVISSNFINDEIGTVNGRVFVDSAPVLDRAWAKKSGLGWIGKNGMLINKEQGSFFFLAEIILDLELIYDNPITDHCGTCRACIDACPTNAILPDKVVDGSKCIYYFTIELKDEILPNEVKGKFDDWVFGCDICQDVCPWNRFSLANNEPKFSPNEKLLNYSKKEWRELTEEIFQEIFKKSAVKRTKYRGLKRNIDFMN